MKQQCKDYMRRKNWRNLRGGGGLLQCSLLHHEYYVTSVRHDAEVPRWDASIKMSYSSHVDASNKNETETTAYKTKDPGENVVLNWQCLTKFGKFLLRILFQLTSSAHILLCSWIVGWKLQVVCQSEHEQQHLLWTYNALGRVRIAFYRRNSR
jgi:hypothetical protein